MQTVTLSRLEKVDLRTVWPNEAGDFTPWLAQAENLRLLGDTIGLELECECQEKAVGPFSADILCRDTTTSQWILIENQIERTDHTHLGQLLTYAAGLKAATIVWVAKEFRDEHRAALDWLNEITSEDFRFFGLEVELWRIADSPAAPKFNVVCQPNDWSRDVRETARDGELTDSAQLQREFWSEFFSTLTASGWKGRTPKPQPASWMTMGIGRSNACLCLATSTSTRDKGVSKSPEIRIELLLVGNDSPESFAALELHREHIDAALIPDQPLWHEREGVQQRRIYVRRDADIRNRADWPTQHEWLRQRLTKFEQVFRPLVAELGRG